MQLFQQLLKITNMVKNYLDFCKISPYSQLSANAERPIFNENIYE